MKMLGQAVSCDGNVRECVRAVVGQMWDACFGNMCAGLVSSSERVKLAFI